MAAKDQNIYNKDFDGSYILLSAPACDAPQIFQGHILSVKCFIPGKREKTGLAS